MALVTGIAEGRIPLPSREGPNGEHSFSLEHLAGVLSSDREDVLVPGLRIAVQKFVAQDGDKTNSRSELLDAYIESSPQAVELQTLWGTVTRRPSSPSLINLIMTVLATVVPRCHSLAKWLVCTSIPDILTQTARSIPFDCVKSALLLLLALSRVGGSTAKSLVKRLPFSESTFINLTAPPPENDTRTRYTTLQLLSSFLEDTQEPSVQIACAITPGALNLAVHHPITMTIDINDAANEAEASLRAASSILVLHILKDQILLNAIIPHQEKKFLFVNHHAQVITILGMAMVDEAEGVRRAALELVTLLCMHRNDSPWLNAGEKGRTCVLSMLVRIGKGEKMGPKYGPCYDLATRAVVGASLEASPVMAGPYMKACASFCSLDPSTSLRGLLTYRYISWILANFPLDPSTEGDIATSLPTSVCRRDLTKAVMHTNWLLRCSGLTVVLSALKRADKMIQRNRYSTTMTSSCRPFSVSIGDNIQNALTNRIPDIKTIFSLLPRLCSATTARSDAVSIIAWNLLLEVLVIYQRVLPKTISSSKFDLAKILPSFNGVLTAPPSIQQRMLLILARAEARQISWLRSSTSSTSISPLALSLRILASTPHLSVRNAAQCACLRALSLIAPEDADVWVEALVRNSVYSVDEEGNSGAADFIASVALCVSRDPYVFAMYCINSTEIAMEQFGLTVTYEELGISPLSVAVLLILKGNEFILNLSSPARESLKDVIKTTTVNKKLELWAADALQACLLRSKDPLLCASFFLYELLSSPGVDGYDLGHGAFYLARALYRTSGLELECLINSRNSSIDAAARQRILSKGGDVFLLSSPKAAEKNGEVIAIPDTLALIELLFPILSFSYFATSLLASFNVVGSSSIDELWDGLDLECISPCMAPEVCALLWSSYSHIQYEKAAVKESSRIIFLQFLKLRLKLTTKLILLASEKKRENEEEEEHSCAWKEALEIFTKSKIVSSLAKHWPDDAREELMRAVVALLIVMSKMGTFGSSTSRRRIKIFTIAGPFLRCLCDYVATAVRTSNWEILMKESGPLAACINWCDDESTGKLLRESLVAFPAWVSHYDQYNACDTAASTNSSPNEMNHLLLSLVNLAEVDGNWSLTSCLVAHNATALLSPRTALIDSIISRAGVLVVCCCEIMSKICGGGRFQSSFVNTTMTARKLKEEEYGCCDGGDAACTALYRVAEKLTMCMVSRSTFARAVLDKWVSEKEELVMKSKALWPVLLCAAKSSGSQTVFQELPSLLRLLGRTVVPSFQLLYASVPDDSEFHFPIQPLMAALHLDDDMNSSITGEKSALALFRCLPLIWHGCDVPEDFLDLVCNVLIEAPTEHENLVLEVGRCLLKRAALACEDDSQGSSSSPTASCFSSLIQTLFSFMSSPLGETACAAPALSRFVNDFTLIALQNRFSDPVVLDTVRCIFISLNSNLPGMLVILSSSNRPSWNVEDMHQRLLSHSTFLEVLLCENGHDVDASCSLLSILVVLASSGRCNPLSSYLVELLLSSYGMSMNHRDQLILRLLWLHGGLAGATLRKVSYALLQRAISTGKASTTIKRFPIYRPLTPPPMEFEFEWLGKKESAVAADYSSDRFTTTTTSEVVENEAHSSDASGNDSESLSSEAAAVKDESNSSSTAEAKHEDSSLLKNPNISSEILDPAFVIPALHTALHSGSISLEDLTDKGQLLAMCVMAISSHVVSMRAGGYACLNKVRELLSSSIVNMDWSVRYNIKQTAILLELLRDGTSSSLNRLPFSSAVFFAQTLHAIACSPGSSNSALVLKSFLQSAPSTGPPSQPNIPILMFGKESNSTSRSFGLQCLANGIRSEEDIRFLSRTRIVPRLLPLLDVVSKRNGKAQLEEDVICLLEAVAKRGGRPGAQYLVGGGGMVDWVWARLPKGQTTSLFEPFNPRILRTMHVTLERMALSEENNKQKGDGIGTLLYSLSRMVLAFATRYAKVRDVVEMALRILLVARYKTGPPLLIPSAALDQLRGEIESLENGCLPSFISEANKTRFKEPEQQQQPKASHSVECSLFLQLLCLKKAMVTFKGDVECTLRLLQWALVQLHRNNPDLEDLSSRFLCRVDELLIEDDPFFMFAVRLLASNDPNLGCSIVSLFKGLLSLGLHSSKDGIAALRPVVLLVTSSSSTEEPPPPDSSLYTRLLPSLFIRTAKRCWPILKRHDRSSLLIEGGGGGGEHVASVACGMLLSILTTDKNEMGGGEKQLLENTFSVNHHNLPEGYLIPSVVDLENLLLPESCL